MIISTKLDKRNIIVVGSESRIAQKVISNISRKNDNITTVSRHEISSIKSNNHFKADLSDIEEIKSLSREIEKYSYDVLIYLAGYFKPQKLVEVSPENILEQVNINLVAAICISSAVLKKMSIEEKGMILFVGSSSSYSGFKNTSVYCSTKHGLLGLSRSLSEEYRNLGIKISCISPGSVNTKMSKPLHSSQDPSTFIDPDELADLIIKLIYNTPFTFWQEEIILKRLKY